MATNSTIAVKTKEGYLAIYCHSDGYTDYMYPMLTTNYNSEELATKLVNLGDASYIDKKLEPTSDYHKFGMPEPDVCMFYHRDRGESWTETQPVLMETKKRVTSSQYYSYIFEDGEWQAYQGGRKVDFE